MNEYRTNIKLIGGTNKKFHYHVRYNNENTYTSNFVYTVQFNDIDIDEVAVGEKTSTLVPKYPNAVKAIRFYDRTLLDNEISAINNYNEFVVNAEKDYKELNDDNKKSKYNSYNDYIDDVNYHTKNIEKQYLIDDNGVFKSINYIDYLPYKIDDSNENLLSYLKTQNSQFRTFVDNENENDNNERTNKINYNTVYGDVEINNININSIDLFFPLYSVETYNTQPPLYYLQLSTYLNGVKIILTERFIDKRKLKIYNRLIRYNNREYYDYITVDFPNVKDIIYSDKWREFRKLYCMTNFDVLHYGEKDKEINDSNCDLYIELHPIYLTAQNDFKFSEIYENDLESIKQLIINTYNDKSNFKGGSNVIQMLSSEQSTEMCLHSYINVLENSLSTFENVINGIFENNSADAFEELKENLVPSISNVIEFGNTFNDYYRQLKIGDVKYTINDIINYLEEVYNLASFNSNNDLYIVTDFSLYIKTNKDLYKYYNGRSPFIMYNDYLDAIENSDDESLKEILESLTTFAFIYKEKYKTIKKQYTDEQATLRYDEEFFEFDKWNNSFINGLNAYVVCGIYAFNYSNSEVNIEKYFEALKNTEDFCFGITLNSNMIPFIKENFKYFLSDSNFKDKVNVLELIESDKDLEELKNNIENMKVLNIVNKVVKNNIEMDLNNQNERVNYITKPIYYQTKSLSDLTIDKNLSKTYEVVINGLERQLDISVYTLRLVGNGSSADFISTRVDRLKPSIWFTISIDELPEYPENSKDAKAYILDVNGDDISEGTYQYA